MKSRFHDALLNLFLVLVVALVASGCGTIANVGGTQASVFVLEPKDPNRLNPDYEPTREIKIRKDEVESIDPDSLRIGVVWSEDDLRRPVTPVGVVRVLVTQPAYAIEPENEKLNRLLVTAGSKVDADVLVVYRELVEFDLAQSTRFVDQLHNRRTRTVYAKAFQFER